MRKNHYRKLLNLEVVKDIENLGYWPSSQCHTSPYINDLNAKNAGLFNDLDIIELDKRIAREKRQTISRKARPEKPFKRVTVQNASKEEVQAALHNVLVKTK